MDAKGARGFAGVALALAALLSTPLRADPQQSLDAVRNNPDFVAIDGLSGVTVSLRYASTRNFLKRDLYGAFNRAFLHRIAADKLRQAGADLAREKPGWKILIYDALRPRAVQRVLWDAVKGTPLQPYVANPANGSIHNFGLAVDVTLVDDAGREIDMGTPFDAFGALAQPALEDRFLKEGKLTATHLENRRLLRRIMTAAGFIQLPLEWWHYDALPQSEVRKQFKIVE